MQAISILKEGTDRSSHTTVKVALMIMRMNTEDISDSPGPVLRALSILTGMPVAMGTSVAN